MRPALLIPKEWPSCGNCVFVRRGELRPKRPPGPARSAGARCWANRKMRANAGGFAGRLMAPETVVECSYHLLAGFDMVSVDEIGAVEAVLVRNFKSGRLVQHGRDVGYDSTR